MCEKITHGSKCPSLWWKYLHYIKSPYVFPCIISCPWSWGDKKLVLASNPRIELINHHCKELLQFLHDPQLLLWLCHDYKHWELKSRATTRMLPGCWITVATARLEGCLTCQGLGMSEMSSFELLGSEVFATIEVCQSQFLSSSTIWNF